MENYKSLVDKELKNIFALINKDVKRKKVPKILYEAMYYSVFSGGKRIRPILCLAVYDALTDFRNRTSDFKKILPFACGLEFIHTFSLIQDDLPSMDNDDFRRGKPSVHKTFSEGVALLAADALFAMAFELFAKAKVEDKRKITAIGELANICGKNGLVAGQAFDIKYQISNIKYQKLINEKKTATLIAGSMKIGTIIAGARKKVINNIEKAGAYLGLLFQATDDILDMKDYSKEEKNKIQVQARKYANDAQEIFTKLGNNFKWFTLFTNHILERKA